MKLSADLAKSSAKNPIVCEVNFISSGSFITPKSEFIEFAMPSLSISAFPIASL